MTMTSENKLLVKSVFRKWKIKVGVKYESLLMGKEVEGINGTRME